MTTFEWIVVVELAVIALASLVNPPSVAPVIAAAGRDVAQALVGVVNSLDDIESAVQEIHDHLKDQARDPAND